MVYYRSKPKLPGPVFTEDFVKLGSNFKTHIRGFKIKKVKIVKKGKNYKVDLTKKLLANHSVEIS